MTDALYVREEERTPQPVNASPANATTPARSVLLVGNPNVGKSVIFGFLTGRYVTVANYPGTTVEVSRGRARRSLHEELTAGHSPASGPVSAENEIHVIDTPGVNTLIPMSEDERVTRDILLTEESAVVVQVADAKNLRRALLVTLQLAELGKPMILVLNMMDEARARGVEIDVAKLSDILGVPVVPAVATRRTGMRALIRALREARPSRFESRYDPALESAGAAISALLPAELAGRRALALALAAGDETLREWAHEHLGRAAVEQVSRVADDLRAQRGEPVPYAINRQRLAQVDFHLGEFFTPAGDRTPPLAVRLGGLAMHPLWGVPILVAVLAGVFEFVGVFGAGTLVGWVEDGLFGRLINPAATRLVEAVIPIPLVRDLLVGEYGVITMALTYGIAIVLPIVFTFFIAFSILEDSGYLPRLAVMVNRIFRGMGLNGKAVLPMVLGLGCDTMATLTTRILDRKKERVIVTLLLALGVPCSAQLGVILGMLGQAGIAAAAVWGGVVLGVLFLVGYLAARVLPGESSAFVLELPPMRLPQFGNILVKTMARIEWYLREALPLFVVGTLVLFTLDAMNLLLVIERIAAPVVVGLLDLPAEAAECFIIGFLRRDYGAAGFFNLEREGLLDPVQLVVALVTMTLFIPCIANWFVMIKERGLRTTLWMTAFILPFALLVGGVLNLALRAAGFGAG